MSGDKQEGVNGDELTGEVVKREGGLPPVRSYYDDFVEGVATRQIARGEGADVGKTARVFQTEDDDGAKTVHLVGRSDIVSGLGDVMERGGYRVREWHVRRPEEAGREAEKVLPALRELVRSVPEQMLPGLGVALRDMGLLGASDKASDAAEAALGLNEALACFEPHFDKSVGEEVK
jgi:hypothetical protein